MGGGLKTTMEGRECRLVTSPKKKRTMNRGKGGEILKMVLERSECENRVKEV
jgi:hypothetical protein